MKSTLLLFIFAVGFSTFGQIYTGPIPRPTSGYGADGIYSVSVESFSNPYYPEENIRIYHPTEIATPVPTLFYCHGYGGYLPAHAAGLFNFIAQKGYAIVFVPYQTTGVTVENRYQNLAEGFRKAARDYAAIIDTNKVGVLGHSFGGGASFGTSYTLFTENNWGSSGRFIHSSAPWYLYGITPEELHAFPSDTKLIVEVYDNDSSNDHRMAADAFININIPNSEKDFIKVYADTIDDYIYTALHNTPTTYVDFDAYDYYAYYRLLDALCDYTFNGNEAGKEVALGNGSGSQINMPSGLKNLEQTDTPTVSYPEDIYTFPCSSVANPRNSYCGLMLSTATEDKIADFQIYPNPATSNFQMDMPQIGIMEINIYNLLGECVLSTSTAGQSIQVDHLPNGIYVIYARQNGQLYQTKFLKE